MNNEEYMKKCINLALQADGDTSPNPLVGCVVTDKFGNVLSIGYHKKCGQNHAERDALLKITPEIAKGGILYVNLEPCSHYGKTPPCADLIVEYGLSKVVVGMRDVNPIVAGNGIEKLKIAGIDVEEGVLEDECKKLNEVFIKNMTKKQTFVAIKTATTLDGKIATKNGSSKWITSEKARGEVQKIRHRYDALLTSSETVLADNPSMIHKCNVLIDRTLKTLEKDYKIYKNKNVIVFYDENLAQPIKEGVRFIKTPVVDGKIDLKFVFDKLYELGVMSVLIEAGGKLNGSALKFADKIYHFIAPKILADNEGRSCFDCRHVEDINLSDRFEIDSVERFESDLMLTYYSISR